MGIDREPVSDALKGGGSAREVITVRYHFAQATAFMPLAPDALIQAGLG